MHQNIYEWSSISYTCEDETFRAGEVSTEVRAGRGCGACAGGGNNWKGSGEKACEESAVQEQDAVNSAKLIIRHNICVFRLIGLEKRRASQQPFIIRFT